MHLNNARIKVNNRLWSTLARAILVCSELTSRRLFRWSEEMHETQAWGPDMRLGTLYFAAEMLIFQLRILDTLW